MRVEHYGIVDERMAANPGDFIKPINSAGRLTEQKSHMYGIVWKQNAGISAMLNCGHECLNFLNSKCCKCGARGRQHYICKICKEKK